VRSLIKVLTLILGVAIFQAPTNLAHAAPLTPIKVPYSQTTDIWTLAFARDNNSLYFAENGGTRGVRQILNSQLTSSGNPIETTSDGFATFRSANTNWQNAMMVASPTVGLNGSSWVYSTGGNINKPASPTDSSGVSQSGVVWAINTSNNDVTYINAKRSDGTWQNGQMYWIAITPDGRYFYVMAHKPGVGPTGGNEIFKFSTATNTQVGLGINSPNYSWGNMTVDNNYVYFPTTSGIFRIGINADNTKSTGDSTISQMTITGTASSFNFANYYSVRNIDGMLYVTGTDNTMAVINGSTGVGTSFTLTNPFNSGRFFGLRQGADGCLYAGSTLDRSLNRINPHTREVIASTGAITNFNPYWENSFSMSPDGRRYAISPRTAVNNGLYIVEISGSECAPPPSTTISLSVSNTPSYRTATALTATVNAQGKVTFFANGKRIPGCISRITSGISPITATCNWRPTQRGSVRVHAVFTPNDLITYERISSTNLNRGVANRSGAR
jgi:hypothetical protein